MGWARFFWSIEGRINRLTFFAVTQIANLVAVAILFVLVGVFGNVLPVWTVATASGLSQMLTVAPFVRRAHDLGFSDIYSLPYILGAVLVSSAAWLSQAPARVLDPIREPLLVLALLAIVVPTVAALLVPGQLRANRFGTPPKGGWSP